MASDYSHLPEPTQLVRSAIVEFTWGDQKHKVGIVAADVVTEPWEETGQVLDWLHCKGFQIFGDTPGPDQVSTTILALIPASYVTSFEKGPTYRVTERRKTEDGSIFPPNHPTPANSLGVDVVRERVAELTSHERN